MDGIDGRPDGWIEAWMGGRVEVRMIWTDGWMDT